ncbi:hypothetical protein BD413DRAFT_524682 [Trametes elegans]|nr:hypothetical protein BD413DRAFT_524682 [Trametes elegans]
MATAMEVKTPGMSGEAAEAAEMVAAAQRRMVAGRSGSTSRRRPWTGTGIGKRAAAGTRRGSASRMMTCRDRRGRRTRSKSGGRRGSTTGTARVRRETAMTATRLREDRGIGEDTQDDVEVCVCISLSVDDCPPTPTDTPTLCVPTLDHGMLHCILLRKSVNDY